MKTGLLTFYHIHHYGAMLQAYATEQAVESLGSECEIIDYYVNQDNALFRRPTGLGSAAHDAHTALHYSPLKKRYERFEAFSRERLNISGHRYQSLEELRQADLPYDLLLSGSDQIWNPKIFPDGRFDPVFFGAFSDRRKIAYAPSFGIPRVPEGMEEELRRYLDAFSHLSVRERQGQAIVREITGKDAPVVLDPTLLLTAEQWAAAASEHYFKTRGAFGMQVPAPAPGGYILCYCISRPGALAPYIREFARISPMPIVQLCGIRQKVHPRARCVLDAGPAEFLELFANAAFVFTNSFHGTVFATQFGVPFYTTVSPSELANPESSRIFSLLSRLGLSDRMIGAGGGKNDLEAPVDWAAAHARLAEAREDSRAYLRAALENRPYEEKAAERTPDAPPRLADRSHCTGCTACASICPRDAITMKRDLEGFAYPAVDIAACIHCGRCTAACPGLAEGRPQGSLPAVFAAWNPSDEIRKDSTSGGVFTLLAEHVLESGGVVCGAAFDSRMHLRHVACFRKEELWRLRGSKYIQSDLDGVFREIKQWLTQRPVLFSGTPCQVDGLYRYLGTRPENLTTCDLVCSGVPSPGVWEDLVRQLEQRRRQPLQAVRFRNKVTGWKNSHFTAVYGDGTVDTAPLYHTEYGRAFGRALFLRPACHHCPYTSMTRVADLTLGDFWGLRPDELPDQQEKGVSLLLVNTAHGSYVFDQLPLAKRPFPPERAIAGNPRLASPPPASPDRAAFFAAYAVEPFDQVRREFFRLPPLPVRAAAKLLSPEVKAAIRKKLR